MPKRIPTTKGFASIVENNSMLAVRIINPRATNIHIIDKRGKRKFTTHDKRTFDRMFEVSEAIRTDDIRSIVEHVNQCNRHSYRMKFGREPPNDYIELKIHDDYFAETLKAKCPRCSEIFEYANGQKRIKCPNCGTEGSI